MRHLLHQNYAVNGRDPVKPVPRFSVSAYDAARALSELSPAEREAAVVLVGIRTIANALLDAIDRK
jgi:hypothetical protein